MAIDHRTEDKLARLNWDFAWLCTAFCSTADSEDGETSEVQLRP